MVGQAFIMSIDRAPNTALEPTALALSGLRFGRRLAKVFRDRGSAFVR